MTIDAYRFGRMVVDGQAHTTDLLLWDEVVQPNWWCASGHRLVLEDIAQALDQARPEVIVVGTGALGLLKVDPALVSNMGDRHIAIDILPTGRAVDRFNRLVAEGRRVLGAFHLTC